MSMRYSNLHTHTTYSDGKNTVRETVEEAIRRQMLSIGFSDHSFTAIDTSYCMPQERYEDYAREILALKEAYADRIPVYLGMELDYYSAIPTIPLDYTIASVHYIVENGKTYAIDHAASRENPGLFQRECADEAFGGSLIGFAERYFSMLAEHVHRVKPTLVGHFDVITKFSIMPEEDPRYLALATDALSAVARDCPFIEVNTGAISRGYRTVPYPIPPLLRHMKAIGAHPVLSADSHKNENLTFHFDQTVDMLRAIGFRSLAVFNGNGYDEHSIL